MSIGPDDDFEQLSVPGSVPVRSVAGTGKADASGASWQRTSSMRTGARRQLGPQVTDFEGVGRSSSVAGPSLKSRAIAYLSRREHSRTELQRKLQPYANPEAPEELARLLDELEQGKWLSNQRFAQSLVNRKASNKGAALIIRELKQHGLPATDLETFQDQLQSSEYERAQAVWARKFGVAPADPREYARQVRFLASRGFSPAILRRILGELDDSSS